MDEFRLKVSTQDYQVKIDRLENLLSALKEHMHSYEEMRTNASNVISSNYELQQVQRVIAGQIKKVEDAIHSVEKQIKVLRDLVSSYEDLGENVRSILEGAVEIADIFS